MAKTCLKCGSPLDDDARFCPGCGSEYSAAPVCPTCGCTLAPDARFCPNCGSQYGAAPASVCVRCGCSLTPGAQFCPSCGANQAPAQSGPGENYFKKGFDTFVNTINSMAGESGKVDIHVRELFSEVAKKHSQEEKDELFACGTSKTTPKESEMIAEWPRPWLYSRVFLLFAVVFAGLYFMVSEFEGVNAVPGAMFVGALIMPLTVMVFLWEANIPRNISIVDVISMFFVGGVFSLVATFLLHVVFTVEELNYIGAITVGIVEEVAKVLLVAYYVKKRNTKYKLNGLLMGACVGAGFAVFESAGYAFSAFLNTYIYAMMYGYYPWTSSVTAMWDSIFLRGVLAIGGHVVWAAISGVGLVVAKGDEPLQFKHFYSPKFLKFLALVAALHAVWDMPIEFGDEFYLVQWILTAIAVATVLVLLGSGLRQVSSIAKQAQEAEAMQREGGIPYAANQTQAAAAQAQQSSAVRVCPQCGAMMTPDIVQCPRCGKQLEG